jgi:hypothetical protein
MKPLENGYPCGMLALLALGIDAVVSVDLTPQPH